MRTKNLPVLALLGGLIATFLHTGTASAQEAGRLRLWMEADAAHFQQLRFSGDGFDNPAVGESEDQKFNMFGFGPTGTQLDMPRSPFGFGVGFAATDNLVVGGRFGFGIASVADPDGDDERIKLRALQFRPQAQYLFSGRGQTGLYVLAGMDVDLNTIKDDDGFKLSSLGYGPALGVGAHVFVTPRASLDIQTTAHYQVGKEKVSFDDESDEEQDWRSVAALLTVGLSVWP